MSVQSRYRFGIGCALVWFAAMALYAQNDEPAPNKEKPKLPTIADEPKTNDPSTFMPAQLAKVATADFGDSSLREVLVWLREKEKLVVLLDTEAMEEIGVLSADPISERLDKAPVYLLLDRLRSLGLAWYFEDEILHLTSRGVAEGRLTTLPYNIGDLVDTGYEAEVLSEVIQNAVSPASWQSAGGPGAISSLGDVLFVRQTDQRHREIRGLLAALRKHGRRTFAFDPPQHSALRVQLEENVKVAFNNTPLESAVQQLAKTANIDIRLDLPALRDHGVRQREPVTLSLSDRKLSTVLRAMLINLKLTWILRDGALWITSQENADAFLKTAVYDVRDLCRDEAESDALSEAIVAQTEPVWGDVGGPGTIQFPRPGTLVVHNTESVLDEVLNLLETYRSALRASKPRKREVDDPNEVITVYYRMHAGVAKDLSTLLLQLVRPKTWKSNTQPDGPGEIFRATSEPGPSNPIANVGLVADAKQSPQSLVMERAVLIIHQTRAAHDDIAKVIARVESGDASMSDGFGGGGGGGFGGGFFAVPPGQVSKPRQ